MKQILPMKKVWSVKEMHKLVNKMINNRIAKNISLIKKRSRYCNNVKNTFKDGYRKYKPSSILLRFLNSCVSILGVLLLRAITFWYVFPIFDILGIFLLVSVLCSERRMTMVCARSIKRKSERGEWGSACEKKKKISLYLLSKYLLLVNCIQIDR
mgnify:CR=1 FL=1